MSIDMATVRSTLLADEGFRPSAYQDSEGYWTIGIGTLIDARLNAGITRDEAWMLAENRFNAACADLDRNAPWWRNLSDKRQLGLAFMAFNMGWPRLSGFQKMLTALQAGDFKTAAAECLDSDAARKLPNRYRRIANMIEEG